MAVMIAVFMMPQAEVTERNVSAFDLKCGNLLPCKPRSRHMFTTFSPEASVLVWYPASLPV
jgi:hypothetical protein